MFILKNEIKEMIMKLLVACALLLVSFGALVNFYDGNDLRLWSMALTKSNLGNYISSREAADASLFQGYVAGVYEYGESVYFCSPEKLRLIQLTDTVTNFINEHPDLRNKPAANLVEQALMDSFPCNKK